jgi:hypothetical protein
LAGSDDEWEVVAATLYNPGDPGDGAQESVLVHSAEAEARRVYAEEIARAAESGYRYVRLRCAGQDVEWWPPETGWTS